MCHNLESVQRKHSIMEYIADEISRLRPDLQQLMRGPYKNLQAFSGARKAESRQISSHVTLPTEIPESEKTLEDNIKQEGDDHRTYKEIPFLVKLLHIEGLNEYETLNQPLLMSNPLKRSLVLKLKGLQAIINHDTSTIWKVVYEVDKPSLQSKTRPPTVSDKSKQLQQQLVKSDYAYFCGKGYSLCHMYYLGGSSNIAYCRLMSLVNLMLCFWSSANVGVWHQSERDDTIAAATNKNVFVIAGVIGGKLHQVKSATNGNGKQPPKLYIADKVYRMRIVCSHLDEWTCDILNFQNHRDDRRLYPTDYAMTLDELWNATKDTVGSKFLRRAVKVNSEPFSYAEFMAKRNKKAITVQA